MSGKVIQYNAAIFPKIMSFYLEATDTTSGCFIDLPRGVSHLYLSSLKASTNARELELFEKYANGMAFTEADAKTCVQKMKNFFAEVERLTTH